jgi:hypothetical protein
MGVANPTHTVPMHVKKREQETTSELQGAGKNVQDEIREHSGVNLVKWLKKLSATVRSGLRRKCV